MTKFLNISTDTTLGGASPSDVTVSSQKAVKAYVDSQTGTAPTFANITGQPSDNANLAAALNSKADVDLSNITPTATAKSNIAGWGMPDYTAGTSYTMGSNFTPTKNGFFIGALRNSKYNATNYITFSCNGTQVYSAEGTTANGNIIPFIQPLAKGNTYNLSITYDDAYSAIKFYPCLGEN